jgi:TldD protein
VKRKAELAHASLARGSFTTQGFEDLERMSMAEKLALVRESEARMRAEKGIQSAFCQYAEIFEEKQILTTDGANCIVRTARPELRFGAFAEDGGRVTSGFDAIGTTGSWQCLFEKRPVDSFIETAAKNAVDLLHAPAAHGGRHTVILSPAMVGLLSHEAIGHTVEADFVKSGSAAQGKLGQMIASELVTLCDSGVSEIAQHAGGTIPVDDEGVIAGRTVIIEKGKLVSYLHNRQSAAEFGAEPTGNARAWEYTDEPLIRMRNTYIEPGKDNLSDMIGGIEDGYFVDGPEGGQADATADFMFGASRVHRIRGGKIAELVQKVTVSGNAFEALASVDAVSSDFAWDLGSGHCGKGQPAKVDAGGPYLRMKLLVGGEQ